MVDFRLRTLWIRAHETLAPRRGIAAEAALHAVRRALALDPSRERGATIVPNLELTPESSHNANLGLPAQQVLPPQLGDLWFDATGFLRHSENMIADMMAQDLLRRGCARVPLLAAVRRSARARR